MAARFRPVASPRSGRGMFRRPVRLRHPSREGHSRRHPLKWPENTELRAIVAILPSLAHRMKKHRMFRGPNDKQGPVTTASGDPDQGRYQYGVDSANVRAHLPHSHVNTEEIAPVAILQSHAHRMKTSAADWTLRCRRPVRGRRAANRPVLTKPGSLALEVGNKGRRTMDELGDW